MRHQGWSQFANPFDGLTFWSYLSGRGKLILDPDYIRLNTFANEAERRSVISLCLMAGAPIIAADEYDTVFNTLSNYQNREILALNEDGFVGKPLTNDPTKEASQIWKGQMTNGDWVVGLFNRENAPLMRSIDFASLGFTKPAFVRDLWLHSDLGSMTSFEAEVAPHGCVVVKISKRKSGRTNAPEFGLQSDVYSEAQTLSFKSTTPVREFTTPLMVPNPPKRQLCIKRRFNSSQALPSRPSPSPRPFRRPT